MSEKQQIGWIYEHTDDDTDMYKLGEIDCCFDYSKLSKHVKTYGSDNLIKALTNMKTTVLQMQYDIDQEQNIND